MNLIQLTISKNMNKSIRVIALAIFLLATTGMAGTCMAQNKYNSDMENLRLTQIWDKKFPQSDKVKHHKVTFKNRFGIELAADVYEPENLDGSVPAIAVAGPFGAVKEQVSGRYAQAMAERGFVTLAFDPSFTGESGGQPRNTASPDINTEDFSAAVDFLTTLPEVDAERIGIIGICGWGGMALNTAAIDTRVKATVTVTMYNMSEQMHDGYQFAPVSVSQLYATKTALNAQRTTDARNGAPEYAGGFPKERPADAPQFILDYWDFYMSPERGYIDRAPACSTGWTKTTPLSFINTPLDTFIGDIEAPVLLIHGEKAHSRYFSEEAFVRLKGDNKELIIVPGANHTDLYDNLDKIPFDKIETFFKNNLTK